MTRNENEKIQKRKSNKENKEVMRKKKKRFLVRVNILGSTGPLRFVVEEDDDVSDVIDTVLKLYAREGRLPILGFDTENFFLYCPNAESDALSPYEKIGMRKEMDFLLCKKPEMINRKQETKTHKDSGLKGWIKNLLASKQYVIEAIFCLGKI